MTNSQFKMIVCDLDGTLVDSMSGFGTIAQDVMNSYYGMDRAAALEAYQRTSGLPFRFQLEKLFPKDPRNEDAARLFEDTKKTTYDERPFFADVIEVVPRLIEQGYQFSVSSNNDELNVHKKMHSLSNLFAEILGFKDGFLKGRAHFQLIKNKYQFADEEILFIGDSLHDARMGFENQIQFVARLGTFNQSNFQALDVPVRAMVHDFYELEEFLEGSARAARRIGRR